MEPTLTFGQKLVGVTFNPSQNPKVDRIKEISAELADIVYEHWCRDAYSEKSFLENSVFQNTISQILNAQMNSVKLITFQY